MSKQKTARQVVQTEFALDYMTEHDLLEVVEIEESSGLSCWGWEAYFAELARERESIMVVARRRSPRNLFDGAGERAMLGFIAARVGAGELHINNVAVREAYRGQGIGATLLKSALEEGRRRGVKRALLEVRAANIIAQALYARQGFKATGRRRHYYSLPPDDALVMAVEF